MSSLAGRGALIVGEGHPYSELCRAALQKHGAWTNSIASDSSITFEEDVDILVICSPALRPGDDVAVAQSTAVMPAERWASAFADVLRARRSGGVIVHVTGLAGLGGWPGWEAASMAHAAIHSLMRSTAVSLARHAIRVNALVPGIDERLAQDIATASNVTLDDIRERIPARRMMPDVSLANALVYLVHSSSSYVSGETLVVDGGWDTWGRLAAVAP